VCSIIVAELHTVDDVIHAISRRVKLLPIAAELLSPPGSLSRVIAYRQLAAMAGGLSGGTGQKLTQATIIVVGVAALLASLLSVV
jgi:hypothetical protein